MKTTVKRSESRIAFRTIIPAGMPVFPSLSSYFHYGGKLITSMHNFLWHFPLKCFPCLHLPELIILTWGNIFQHNRSLWVIVFYWYQLVEFLWQSDLTFTETACHWRSDAQTTGGSNISSVYIDLQTDSWTSSHIIDTNRNPSPAGLLISDNLHLLVFFFNRQDKEYSPVCNTRSW